MILLNTQHSKVTQKFNRRILNFVDNIKCGGYSNGRIIQRAIATFNSFRSAGVSIFNIFRALKLCPRFSHLYQ